MTPQEIVVVVRSNGVHLEPLHNGSMLARIGGDNDKLYDNAITLDKIGPGVYEAKGLVKLPTLEQRRKLRAAMKELGFKMKFARIRKIKTK